MNVTSVFKGLSFFEDLEKILKILYKESTIKNEEIIKNVSEIQKEEDKFSTLSHLTEWKKNTSTQQNFPLLMRTVR